MEELFNGQLSFADIDAEKFLQIRRTHADRRVNAMDPEIKAQADELFASMGMNMSAAVNIFVRQCLREQRLPFRPSLDVPNEETRHAIEEADEMLRTGKLKRYSVEEAFAELEKDD